MKEKINSLHCMLVSYYKTMKQITLLSALIISLHLHAQKIVTWNVKDIFTIEDADKRKADFKKFGEEINPDILILQEVTSKTEVEKIASIMGLSSYDITISNFSNDNNNRISFEVAILSKYKLSNITEYETMTDNRIDNGGTEHKIVIEETGFIYKRAARGFISAYIKDLDLWVTGVHLKSSLGKTGIEYDGDNAQKRETVMLGYKEFMTKYATQYPNTSFLIAGDFNVGHSDQKKNGKDYKNDSADGYDDTHGILKSETKCCSMENKAESITTTTYPGFKGSPIDNIYVYGKITFNDAQKAAETYGSDHLPVYTEITQ